MSAAGRPASILLLVAASATAWFALAPLPAAPRAWTVILLVALPAWTLRQAVALRDIDELPRIPVYLSSIFALIVLAGLTAAAAAAAHFERATLGITALPLPSALLWAALTTAGAIAYALLCRALGMRETATTLRLLPRTRADKAGFTALSLAAGLFEEFVYRGFLIAALLVATGSLPLAILLAAAAFGLVHGYQAPGGILRAAILGLVLTVPFVVTGSLVPGVIAHAGYDVIMGVALGDYLRG